MKNLVIRHKTFKGKYVSIVYNLDSKNINGFIVGVYSTIEKRHKLENKKLKKMIENPSEQFKIFLNKKL